jgi:hypothetical protein
MHLDSARGLKADLMSRFVVPLASAANARAARSTVKGAKVLAAAVAADRGGGDVAIAAGPINRVPDQQRTIALGIVPHEGRNRRDAYKLAIRVQRIGLLDSPEVQQMVALANGEADVRHVGRIVKRARKRPVAGPPAPDDPPPAVPWYRTVRRPLQIGVSIGHQAVTAGTLGCFVQTDARQILMLSNNHVLANENSAVAGDNILQQGRYDGGRVPRNRCGELATWVDLKPVGANLVDAALGTIDSGIEWTPTLLQDVAGGNPHLAGVNPDVPTEGMMVYKVGRTTGPTVGRVTAIEVDNLIVNYDLGNLWFDNQIEVEGVGNASFSDGGDSGSLVVDGDFRAVGLLFAGGETGGSNNLGLTWANPIQTVLDELDVSLIY